MSYGDPSPKLFTKPGGRGVGSGVVTSGNFLDPQLDKSPTFVTKNKDKKI